MIAPDASDFVYEWFGGERVLGDCHETEVGHHMSVSQRRKGIAQQRNWVIAAGTAMEASPKSPLRVPQIGRTD